MKALNLENRIFGKLTVLSKATSKTRTKWLCRCECGNFSEVFTSNLVHGHTKSCGCGEHATQNITGTRFGRLTAISPTEIDEHNGTIWKCICDCGNEIYVPIGCLNSGNTKSCGCYMKDLSRERLIAMSTIHGKRHTILYNRWTRMKSRCYNPKNNRYHRYGGRGIKLCNEWETNFQAFYDWSIKNGFREDLTIDRIDNNENYEPANCRWTDYKTQANNK